MCLCYILGRVVNQSTQVFLLLLIIKTSQNYHSFLRHEKVSFSRFIGLQWIDFSSFYHYWYYCQAILSTNCLVFYQIVIALRSFSYSVQHKIVVYIFAWYCLYDTSCYRFSLNLLVSSINYHVHSFHAMSSLVLLLFYVP